MSNLDSYNEVFIEVFGVSVDVLSDYKYQDTASWDSVGHMMMIVALEEKFNIIMDSDDIVDFSSWSKGITILKKYDVDIVV